MWARVIELMLGVWLGISPFVFGLAADETMAWAVCFGFGLLLVVSSSLAYWEPTRLSPHVVTLPSAIALAVWSWAGAGESAAPIMQNFLVVAVLLLMFAIVPNEATLPPRSRRTGRAAG